MCGFSSRRSEVATGIGSKVDLFRQIEGEKNHRLLLLNLTLEDRVGEV
jgi:hypothetical protein